MEYKNISDTSRYTGIRLLARLAAWRLSTRLRTRPGTIDPRSMPDHLLKDVGLPRPSPAWEESVGFWRVR
jgi:uncharacterized protein YjiS (DUF1127 family)